ncbi:MAG: HTH domain-containing protein [Hyphomicrobiales bacterium]
MKTQKQEILKRIDQLIRLRATGTPSELANKINVSERCIYNYLNFMKELGCPISYSHSIKSYYYEYEGKFFFGFIEDKLNKEKAESTIGGCYNYFNIQNYF